MNLYDLLQDNASLNVTVNAGQLIEVIDYCVNKTRKELEQQITDANTETYPSAAQVAKILDVDKSTLWRWRKQNYLVPIEIGGKRRYRMSDVKRILEG
jgi:transcriptional regulator with PAS, ATPase and Fis domain